MYLLDGLLCLLPQRKKLVEELEEGLPFGVVAVFAQVLEDLLVALLNGRQLGLKVGDFLLGVLQPGIHDRHKTVVSLALAGVLLQLVAQPVHRARELLHLRDHERTLH